MTLFICATVSAPPQPNSSFLSPSVIRSSLLALLVVLFSSCDIWHSILVFQEGRKYRILRVGFIDWIGNPTAKKTEPIFQSFEESIKTANFYTLVCSFNRCFKHFYVFFPTFSTVTWIQRLHGIKEEKLFIFIEIPKRIQLKWLGKGESSLWRRGKKFKGGVGDGSDSTSAVFLAHCQCAIITGGQSPEHFALYLHQLFAKREEGASILLCFPHYFDTFLLVFSSFSPVIQETCHPSKTLPITT